MLKAFRIFKWRLINRQNHELFSALHEKFPLNFQEKSRVLTKSKTTLLLMRRTRIEIRSSLDCVSCGFLMFQSIFFCMEHTALPRGAAEFQGLGRRLYDRIETEDQLCNCDVFAQKLYWGLPQLDGGRTLLSADEACFMKIIFHSICTILWRFNRARLCSSSNLRRSLLFYKILFFSLI